VSTVLVALALMALALMALVTSPARAATLTVTKTADTFDGVCNSDCSLRDALGISNTNGQSDTINFASGARGTITLTGNPVLIVSDSSNPVTINGPGAGALAVSGNDALRVFTINSGADATINGLTIRNGLADGGDDPGGGIRNEGELVLNDSVVRDNSSPTLDGDGDGGGGIYNLGTLTLNRSTVSDNFGAFGGGIANVGSGSEMDVNRSTISGNTSGFDGGGIFNTATLKLNASTVSSNSAGTWGGGIYSSTGSDGVANINNSTISGNFASTDSNFQDGDGGGLYLEGTNGIWHSTITNNDILHSDETGNGVASEGSTGTVTYVTSTIISGNADNSDVALDGDTNSYSSKGYNLVGGGNAIGAFDGPRDLTEVTDPLLGPLAHNGGPTRTHALLPGSRAIDSAGPSPPATDQRGETRPQDGNGDGSATADIGSFEKENKPPVAKLDSYTTKSKTLKVAASNGVLKNDTDPDGDDLTASIVTEPKKGSLKLKADGSFTYTPKKNFVGTVSFTYKVSDGRGGTDTARVNITVR
jgi:CSLREA domain-containing protein